MDDTVTNEMLKRILFPEKAAAENLYTQPDYPYIHKELAWPGVNLTLLWTEYCNRCENDGTTLYMYTQFCEKYRQWAWIPKTTMRTQHKPGDAMQVDWAGNTLDIHDPVTGVSKNTQYETVFNRSYHALDKRRDDIRIAHCWVHTRRDYADAVKLLKKGGSSKQRIKKTIAYQALERIGTMCALEDEWKSLTSAERLSRRQEHIKPQVEAYFAWVKGIYPDTVLSEKTKDGLQYSLNQEKYLRTFLEDGEVPIDNSASKRAIRPFCVGRSNWHVIDSIKGEQASAIVYSIVETAKANNLKPYEYLRHLLSSMMEHIYDTDTAYLKDLMPWSKNPPNIHGKTS